MSNGFKLVLGSIVGGALIQLLVAACNDIERPAHAQAALRIVRVDVTEPLAGAGEGSTPAVVSAECPPDSVVIGGTCNGHVSVDLVGNSIEGDPGTKFNCSFFNRLADGGGLKGTATAICLQN